VTGPRLTNVEKMVYLLALVSEDSSGISEPPDIQMPKHITQKDIAKKLGVTRVTVSKALNDYPDISEPMRRKVKEVATEAGYIVDHGARSLQMRKTNTVGIVIPEVSNSFFSFVIHGIMDAANAHGYRVILTVSREDPEIERQNILTLLSHRIEGLLVAISKDTDDPTSFEPVQKMDVPLVFFDRTLGGLGFSTIGIDDRKAAKEIVEFTISQGYSKIAHLGGSQSVAIGRDRLAGYVDALKKHKIPLKDEWIITGGFDSSSGYEGFKRLMRTGDLPELVFAANDRIAQGAYRAIKEAKLNIPNDIGIAAFGHSEFAELLSPTLTIVDCPPIVLGQKAMELLISEITHPATRGQHHLLIDTTLRVNESILMKKAKY
jgi:LacI family transcriptional regulator